MLVNHHFHMPPQVIAEEDDETHEGFPVLLKRVLSFYAAALKSSSTPAPELVKQRYAKFRAMGRFEKLTPEQMTERFEAAANAVRACVRDVRSHYGLLVGHHATNSLPITDRQLFCSFALLLILSFPACVYVAKVFLKRSTPWRGCCAEQGPFAVHRE